MFARTFTDPLGNIHHQSLVSLQPHNGSKTMLSIAVPGLFSRVRITPPHAMEWTLSRQEIESLHSLFSEFLKEN